MTGNSLTDQHSHRELVAQFMNAWEAGDADGVMAVFGDDCIYAASVGPEPGTTWRGRDAVARGVAQMLAFEAGGESRQGELRFSEDRAFAQWSYNATAPDGRVMDVKGIDIIHFADGRIASIDAYRKTTIDA